MATVVPAKKNTAYIFYLGLASQADPRILQASPTFAAGDVQVATDDGAPGNLATIPVFDADFLKRVKVSLSSTEMNGDNITVIFSDATGAEWCDLIVNIQTAANQIDDVKTDTAAILIDTAVIGTLGAGLTAIPWNATWDAEVQSEVFDALNDAFTDATSLTSNGLLDRMRIQGGLLRNKMTIKDATGNGVSYKDDGVTPAFTVAGIITDDATTTTRLRWE